MFSPQDIVEHRVSCRICKAMPTSMPAAEAVDLAILHMEIAKHKEMCYSYLGSLVDADARQLETSGYKGKTNAEAMRAAFKHYQQTIEHAIVAHTRKYPD